MLNYGYGILASRTWAALLHAGLDPFAGMLHADRSGKPSLVLDLMEELRAPAVDRAVLAYVRLGRPVRFDGNFLDEETRRAIADAVLERLEAPVVIGGKKYQLGSVVQRQARAVATAVRGEGGYKPFAMTW
jgi:CRISPR-associated protein Cas1